MALSGVFDTAQAAWNYATIALTRHAMPAPWREQYKMLMAVYLQNGMYEVLAKMFQGSSFADRDMRPLRNPAYRCVEFYSSKCWPGMLPAALPILTDHEAIITPIEQIWQWSNWSAEKQTYARWAAIFGDSFIKVATNADGEQAATRVFLQNIKPEFVSEMETDERGYLTYIRMDIPRTRKEGDKNVAYTHVEVWTKEEYQLWEHTQPIDTPLSKLGPPLTQTPLSTFGIDFVPIVWMPFRAIGDERGVGAFTLQLEKIDEANRQATRLSQMLFRHNRAIWALKANAMDKAGRPLPPPRIGTGTDSDEELEIDDDTILKLPGMSELTPLVPPIDYAAALEVLNAQLKEIQQDLPELAYYNLRDMGQISGVAVRLLLGDALDRLNEARGNAETALVRAQQMALTLGVNAGLFGGIGTFENGDFDHAFAEREVFPLGAEEKANIAAAYVKAGFPVINAARQAGFSDEELTQLQEDMDKEQAAVQPAETGIGQGGIEALLAGNPGGQPQTNGAPIANGVAA